VGVDGRDKKCVLKFFGSWLKCQPFSFVRRYWKCKRIMGCFVERVQIRIKRIWVWGKEISNRMQGGLQ